MAICRPIHQFIKLCVTIEYAATPATTGVIIHSNVKITLYAGAQNPNELAMALPVSTSPQLSRPIMYTIRWGIDTSPQELPKKPVVEDQGMTIKKSATTMSTIAPRYRLLYAHAAAPSKVATEQNKQIVDVTAAPLIELRIIVMR